MVEPVSIALISGAAGLGAILGRITKKAPLKEEPLPTLLELENKPTPIEPPKLQFFAVDDVVNPVEIIDLARAGTQVFISIKKMLSKTDKLYKFLGKLNQAIDVHKLQLHQISKDILLVNSRENRINVRTLQRMTEHDQELEEKFIHSSIAGY